MSLFRIIPMIDQQIYNYLINDSLRMNSFDTPYLAWTPSVAADSSRIATFCFWFKRIMTETYGHVICAGSTGNEDWIRFGGLRLEFGLDDEAGCRLVASRSLRDPAGHYHCCIGIDTNQSTPSDRVTVELNGEELTDFDFQTYPSQYYDITGFFQNGVEQFIGRKSSIATQYSDGYLSDLRVIVGQKLPASAFGVKKNGIWVPKNPSAFSFGNNGYHLNFANASDPGNDVSGNNNDFTAYNLTTDDRSPDTPTNNHCTYNVAHKRDNTDVEEAGLELITLTTTYNPAIGTQFFDDGKWYAEFTPTVNGGYAAVGIAAHNFVIGASSAWLGGSNSWSYRGSNGNINPGNLTYGDAYTTNDVIGVALNMITRKVWFRKNGVWQNSGDPVAGTGEAFSGLPGLITFGACDLDLSNGATIEANFGQFTFDSTPPSGYLAPCAANRDDPIILNSKDGFAVVKDTGANIAVTLAAARPGWSNYIDIIKNRDALEDWEWIFSDDSSNSIHSNTTAEKGAKQTLVGANNYSGFTIRLGADYGAYSAEISHTTGTDTTQAHGLSGSEFAAIAHRVSTGGGDWWISHPGLTTNYNIKLNSNAGEIATQYIDVDGTNVIIKGAAPSGTYRVIVFANGFISLSYYDGIGFTSDPAPYLFCNHLPAAAIIKRIDTTGECAFYDNAREPNNPKDTQLWIHSNVAEQTSGTSYYLDFYSSGFKTYGTGANINASGGKYITISFPDQPVKYSNGN